MEDSADFSYCNLSNIPDNLSLNLAKLDISINNLIIIDCSHLPQRLQILFAHSNKILNIIYNFPIHLKYLNLQRNYLSSLPELPPVLETLNISDNCFSEIPPLPSSLQQLFADNNSITVIPQSLPESLKDLCLCYNYISNIPESLPKNLEAICIEHNQLRGLPETWPESIYIVRANNNPLNSLPSRIPVSVRYFATDSDKIPPYFPKKIHHIIDILNRESQKRQIERVRLFKEELMQNRWHPTRVLQLLENGEI